MTPKEYYYTHFQKDLEIFFAKLPSLGQDGEFKWQSLFTKVNGEHPMQHIEDENLVFFLSALGCTIMVDEVVYTYFRTQYADFRAMTLYPKMMVSWIHATPWSVFSSSVTNSLAGRLRNLTQVYQVFVRFYITEMKTFFETTCLGITWEEIKESMMVDKDIRSGKYGKIFMNELEQI